VTVKAVRLKVTIVNAVDEALARRDRLSPAVVRRCECEAVVAPDSVWSVIPDRVARAIGVPVYDQAWAGRTVAGPVLIGVAGSDTVEEVIVTGDEVRIGRTVIDKLDLL
jgi:hypothetical protein